MRVRVAEGAVLGWWQERVGESSERGKLLG
jgi:hypothetical protein